MKRKKESKAVKQSASGSSLAIVKPDKVTLPELVKKRKKEFIFSRSNYKLMLFGFAIIAFGFMLMIGGGSDDPNIFNPEIFNFRRIRLAPALVLIGFGIEIATILRSFNNPKKL